MHLDLKPCLEIPQLKNPALLTAKFQPLLIPVLLLNMAHHLPLLLFAMYINWIRPPQATSAIVVKTPCAWLTAPPPSYYFTALTTVALHLLSPRRLFFHLARPPCCWWPSFTS
ncbi:hypothetical protein GOP47_0004512 [Adiantum capillus-veneris]|uniref:Uncharacterized protein n=1 Tax=Adiantum capillus-veneris TaxID=13818 RepID=A0A9D4V7P3_ADICA|nr:hypothetical protein GOP47_0004512 [Adiantum capillus-veneris]